MVFFGHDLAFWFAALGAAVLKIILSPWLGVVKGVISVASALLVAIIFTDPLLAYLNLNPTAYKNAVAALVALTGEGVVRWLLQLVSDPTKVLAVVKAWRGGGGK